MTREIKNLVDKQLFWKTLFETKNLAVQLASLAENQVDGVLYDDYLLQYGKVHVVAQPGSNAGDNFQSDTFIVTARLLQGRSEEPSNNVLSSTFIKVLPSNSFLRQAVDESRVHQREINMYRHVFVLVREMHADQPIPLDVPECYYTHLEEVIIKGETDGSGTCIALQDLKADNYRMLDITRGVDYRHCHMALTSLAHYHAQTMNALRRWKDSSTGELTNLPPAAKFILDEMSMFDVGITHILQNFAATVVNFVKPINRPDLVEWLTDVQQRLPEIMLVDNLESSGPLACILHGDFWNNNMLFKYAEQQTHHIEKEDGATNEMSASAAANIPVSLKMLDFQQSRIGHPLSDVLYFMYTSTMPELRERSMLVLLRYYFDTLTTDLRLLGVSFDNYTWQNFLEDYKKRSLMWMFAGVLMITMTQNKQVVPTLQDMDAAEQNKDPKPDTKVEPVKGESGMSLEMEEKMRNMMATRALSNSSAQSDRILKLILEVKALNDS